MLKRLWLFVVVAVLVSCAALGLEEAKSFPDRLAYAEGLNTALRDASSDALANHEITSQDMEHVIEINKQAKPLLLAARSLMNTDPSTAEGKLLAATKLLTDLQNYLRAKGVKKTTYELIHEQSNARWALLRSHY